MDRDPVEELLHRLWLLGAYRLALKPKSQKLADLHALPQALRVVSAAFEVLDAWPTGFHALLDGTASRYGASNAARLSTRFGGLYLEIFSRRRHEAFADLRQGFEEYVRTRWTGQIAGRNRRLSAVARECHVWVPVRQAASELHWRSSRVRKAIERGLLAGRLNRRASGRITGVVHRASLDQLKEDAGNWLDLQTTCRRLRKGKKALKALIASGQLVPIAGPAVDGGAVWQFQRADVEQLAVSFGTASVDSRSR